MGNPVVGARALRTMVKTLSKRGVSYDAIANATKPPHKWTTSALKQFARRDTIPRITPKLIGLASTVVSIVDAEHSFGDLQESPEITSLKCFIPEQSQNADKFDLAREVGARLKKFRLRGVEVDLPQKFAFARFGRDEEKIIVMLIQLKKFQRGWVFTMKVTGANNRRIVLGDVSRTAANTDFTGISYSVNFPLSNEEFFALDAFDLDETVNLTSQLDLGLERFSMSNVDMAFPVVPTPFVGLDGAGKPISGLGVTIDEQLFEELGIPDYVSSSVDCSAKNKKLKQVMDWCNASTIIPPSDGASGVQAKLAEIAEPWHNRSTVKTHY